MIKIDINKLLEIAGQKTLELEEETSQLDRLLAQSFELKVFFEDSNVSQPAKLKLINQLLPKTLPLFQQFIALLIENRLEKKYHRLAGEITRRAAEKNNLVIAEVASAMPLTEGEKSQISQLLNKKVKVRAEIDQSLIGGLKFRTSDGRFFDGSLQNSLNNLKESLANA